MVKRAFLPHGKPQDLSTGLDPTGWGFQPANYMTTAYVSVNRVKEAMRSSYPGTDDTVLSDMIVSASAWLDTYCNRANGGFSLQSYDELYNGTGSSIIFLNQTPIQSVQRIATFKQPAILIQNRDSDQGTRALVQVIGTPSNQENLNTQYTSTGLTLTVIKAGVTTVNTLLWADFPTISSLVAAIIAVGHNWNATVQGGFGNWSSSDIRATQGAFGARITTAYLQIHWMDLPTFEVINQNSGEIYSPMGFNRGLPGNWRIQYTAGYKTFPDALTQSLAEIVINAYYCREINSNLQSESLGPVSYSQYAKKGFDGLSIMAKQTINRYRIRRVSKFGVY